MATDVRSAAPDVRTLDLFPDHPAPSAPPLPRGVGARQAQRAARRGGGGYLNACTPSELREDVRLRELAEIGLSATWLAIAKLVGYDTFVAIWRSLSADHALRNEHNQIELQLRPFRSYERYQRNRYIDTLVASGFKLSDIDQTMRHHLGEQLSKRQIHRLVAASRSRMGGTRQG
jgi:hypothetical protein